MENRHDIISRINEKYAAMSKGHKAIATYIMEHYDQAAFMTAAKLGAELGISESTVVRFAAGNSSQSAACGFFFLLSGRTLRVRIS